MKILDEIMLWVAAQSMIISAIAIASNIAVYQAIRYRVRKAIKEADQRKVFFKKEEVMKSVGFIFAPAFTLVALSHAKDASVMESINLILRWILFAAHVAVASISVLNLNLVLKTFTHKYADGAYVPQPEVAKRGLKRFLRYFGG